MPELRRHFQGQLDEIDAEVIALLDLLVADSWWQRDHSAAATLAERGRDMGQLHTV